MLRIQAYHIANQCGEDQAQGRSVNELLDALALARKIIINSEYPGNRKSWLQRALNIARELERR